jgi:hypothetical protein
MRRRIDNCQFDAGRLSLLEQRGKLARVSRHRIQLTVVWAAFVPIICAALRINIDNGGFELSLGCANSHVNGNGRFSAATFLSDNG